MNAKEMLKAHKQEIKERFGVKRLGIFGSCARGEEGENSDVDVLVEFVEPNFDNFMELYFYLEDMFRKRVDLVTTGGLSPYIGPHIKKEVVWCE